MEKMLVVVFDNETTAYEGSRALNQLDLEGSITIHAEAVVCKNPDGTVTRETGTRTTSLCARSAEQP